MQVIYVYNYYKIATHVFDIWLLGWIIAICHLFYLWVQCFVCLNNSLSKQYNIKILKYTYLQSQSWLNLANTIADILIYM